MMDNDIQLFLDDAQQVLTELSSDSVDLIVTSPPLCRPTQEYLWRGYP